MKLVLMLMLGGPELFVPKVDGTARLADATDVFCQIDADFKNSVGEICTASTDETRVYPYELIQKATYAEMFSALPVSLDELCLTEHQIKAFVARYAHLIRDEITHWPILFLTKSGGNFYTVRVTKCNGGFCVERYPLSYYFLWSPPEYRYRVVVPSFMYHKASIERLGTDQDQPFGRLPTETR